MKTITLVLILFLTALGLPAQTPSAPGLPTPPAPTAPAAPMTPAPPAAASPDGTNTPAPVQSAPAVPEVPAYVYNLQGVDLNQVLDLYADLVGRTVLRAGLPNPSIVLRTQSPLTKSEAIQALQAVLALNDISLVNIGDKFVKALQSANANAAGAPFNQQTAAQLPDVGSYVIHIVQLKYVKPSELVQSQLLQQFARLPNSVMGIDANGILILRDYAENVKRMLEMVEQVDVNVPAEYISEVIPIKYALAGDIANALGNLGGGGGATVSIGGSTAAAPISGISGQRTSATGLGGPGGTYPGGANQPRALGAQATTGGTPTPGTTFQQRLNAILTGARPGGPGGAAAGQAQIQLFGQTKIIADERSNSLLVFATRPDMETIRNIISKLDVLLSQVLIESAIIDYSLGPNTFDFGLSVAQNPKTFNPNGNPAVAGGGGFNNGQSFLSFLNGSISGLTNATSVFGNSLPGGFSYFGNIGPTWDVALQAAAADSHASIIQRPRIQTSQAKPAQFFVGDTVPYITGYGNYGYGNQSTYSQLSVGVELVVTPFINPDGLVVMDIQQEIDDLNGYTAIANVGNVPNTIKRTLNSEVAVRDKDTIMLGGFIKSNRSTSRSGVPVLMDIPLLGNLFTQRSDSKKREELIVLMRPTVLRTPEIAAAQAVMEERRLPGVSAVEAEDAAAERKQVEAEQKAERRRIRSESPNRGISNLPATNSYAPQSRDSGFIGGPPPSPAPATNILAPPNP